MKSGTCPKCGQEDVYGDLNTPHGISVDRMAVPRINTILLVCGSCGYLEFYVETEEDLSKVQSKFRRVEG
jgi:predicted nucleic-acid-binding Zn-ribbon protein